MKILFSLFAGLIMATPNLASAYVLPTRMILQRTAENAGTATYNIEQEVRFSNGEETIDLKETWIIENENTLRLTVSGTKELQNGIKMQFIYAGGQKWKMIGATTKNEKISEDFFERYLHFRSGENLASALVQNKIIPPGAYSNKKTGKTEDDFKYIPESWNRLSRAGGVPAYALGTATPVDQEKDNPGIWIEQDFFLIRKLRLLSGAEMTADNYDQFTKGLYYPRNRTIRWGNNTANIHVTSVTLKQKSPTTFKPSSLEQGNIISGLDGKALKETILDFYSRFR